MTEWHIDHTGCALAATETGSWKLAIQRNGACCESERGGQPSVVLFVNPKTGRGTLHASQHDPVHQAMRYAASEHKKSN
jgi:hypothetical protein